MGNFERLQFLSINQHKVVEKKDFPLRDGIIKLLKHFFLLKVLVFLYSAIIFKIIVNKNWITVKVLFLRSSDVFIKFNKYCL